VKKIEQILDRDAELRERIGRPDVPPDLKEHFEGLLSRTRDGLTGLQGRSAVDKAVDELFENKIPHAVAMIDFRNLGGLNEKLGHTGPTGADRIIIESVVERLTPAVRQVGGEVYRCGGDEYVAIAPNMKASELKSLLNDVSGQIDIEVIKPNNLENLPHPKNYGLPTGVGIDFGCADSAMAKNRHDELKMADRRCFDAKKDQKDIVVERELQQGRKWVQVDGVYAPQKIATILQTMKRELENEYRVNQEKTVGSRSYGRGSDTRGRPEAGSAIGGSGLDQRSRGTPKIPSGIRTQESGISQEARGTTLGSVIAQAIAQRAAIDRMEMPKGIIGQIQSNIDMGKLSAENAWKGYEMRVEQLKGKAPEKQHDIGLSL